MTPSALVNHGKELEVNLVEPPGEVDHEGRPVQTWSPPDSWRSTSLVARLTRPSAVSAEPPMTTISA